MPCDAPRFCMSNLIHHSSGGCQLGWLRNLVISLPTFVEEESDMVQCVPDNFHKAHCSGKKYMYKANISRKVQCLSDVCKI